MNHVDWCRGNAGTLSHLPGEIFDTMGSYIDIDIDSYIDIDLILSALYRSISIFSLHGLTNGFRKACVDDCAGTSCI